MYLYVICCIIAVIVYLRWRDGYPFPVRTTGKSAVEQLKNQRNKNMYRKHLIQLDLDLHVTNNKRRDQKLDGFTVGLYRQQFIWCK